MFFVCVWERERGKNNCTHVALCQFNDSFCIVFFCKHERIDFVLMRWYFRTSDRLKVFRCQRIQKEIKWHLRLYRLVWRTYEFYFYFTLDDNKKQANATPNLFGIRLVVCLLETALNVNRPSCSKIRATKLSTHTSFMLDNGVKLILFLFGEARKQKWANWKVAWLSSKNGDCLLHTSTHIAYTKRKDRKKIIENTPCVTTQRAKASPEEKIAT